MDHTIRYFWIFSAVMLLLSSVLSHPVNTELELDVPNSQLVPSVKREGRQRWGGGGGGYQHGGGRYHGGGGGGGNGGGYGGNRGYHYGK